SRQSIDRLRALRRPGDLCVVASQAGFARAMWRSFARFVTQFDPTKLEPTIALRNAGGVLIPLAIGLAIGMPLGGVAVASGALQVAYSDGHDPYSQRGLRMLTATVLRALA